MTKLALPPIRPKKVLLAFCDESSHNQGRYFVVGAVHFRLKEGADSAKVVANIESQLTELKKQSGLLDRLKWEKVPTKAGRFLDGYKEFIKSFLETDGVCFKCLVLDTHKYRLNNAERWAGNLASHAPQFCVSWALAWRCRSIRTTESSQCDPSNSNQGYTQERGGR